jgi:hypothetical protein
MALTNIRTKVITEINLIPEDKLEELYNFIHLNLQETPTKTVLSLVMGGMEA